MCPPLNNGTKLVIAVSECVNLSLKMVGSAIYQYSDDVLSSIQSFGQHKRYNS